MDERTRKEEQSLSINDMDYLPVTKNIKESVRVQKTEYIRQQMRRRQEAEDALLAQLIQEQQVIDTLQQQIDENLNQTAESSKFNREFKESMNSQIYSLHGISADKMEGMREYRNAYYQGSAFSLFLLSAALIVLCGVLNGFQSDICVFMLAYTGIEGALLAQEKKRWRFVDWLCKLLYLLMFPVMMVMFVCYELHYPEYDLFLPYATILGVVILVFATAAYFLYNPYRGVRKNVREAKEHIADIEKIARKNVRKNEKIRKKDEKRQKKKDVKDEKRKIRQVHRESRWYAVRMFFHDIGQKIAGVFHFHKKEQQPGPGNVVPETAPESVPSPGSEAAPEAVPSPGSGEAPEESLVSAPGEVPEAAPSLSQEPVLETPEPDGGATAAADALPRDSETGEQAGSQTKKGKKKQKNSRKG